MYVAVQVVEAAGASCVAGHETVPTFVSETATPVSVTLPVFVTRNAYGIVDPAVVPVAIPACFFSVTLGADTIGVVTESDAVTAAPLGGFAVAFAVLVTWPESTSASVSVYVAVHVVDAPGASWVAGHDTVPTFASDTATPVTVTFPVFVTRNVYGTVEVAALPDAVPACFFSVIAGDRVIVLLVELVADTAAPVGGVPDALAVLFTTPASTSACVSV